MKSNKNHINSCVGFALVIFQVKRVFFINLNKTVFTKEKTDQILYKIFL